MNEKFVDSKAQTNKGANVENFKTFHLFELLSRGINLTF